MARRGYPPEFRRRVVALVEEGRKVCAVAAELGVSEQTIYTWRRQARIDAGLEHLSERMRPSVRRAMRQAYDVRLRGRSARATLARAAPPRCHRCAVSDAAQHERDREPERAARPLHAQRQALARWGDDRARSGPGSSTHSAASTASAVIATSRPFWPLSSVTLPRARSIARGRSRRMRPLGAAAHPRPTASRISHETLSRATRRNTRACGTCGSRTLRGSVTSDREECGEDADASTSDGRSRGLLTE